VTTTIIPLGTGGYIPTRRRATASVIVRRDRTALLFDAGTGVGRLLEPAFAAHLEGVDCLNVLLSHYHLDHVIGLTWLPQAWHGRVRIFAPSPPLVDVRARDALGRLTSAPLFALPLDRYPCPPEVVEVASESALEIGDFSLRLMRQRHSGGSVGFRVDDCFAYVTDTDADERHVPFLSGAEIAFMDAFYDTAEYRASGGGAGQRLDHGSNESAAALAKEAGVGTLGLVHINPSYDEHRCSAMLAESRAIFPSTVLPEDGAPIPLPTGL
jgi:ribonuclease BN (tRNA processing enzyme)